MLVSDSEYPKYWHADWGLMYRVTEPGAVAEFLVTTNYWSQSTASWIERLMHDNAQFRQCHVLSIESEYSGKIAVTVRYLDTGGVVEVQV